MYYDELFRLCSYEPEEIERERPRIEKTFEKLEFTPEDIDRGERRVRQYFDLELSSVRKTLGLWLQCLIDLVLAKEEKKAIVYCAMPPFAPLMNAMAMVSKDIFVAVPDLLLAQTVGAIFDKLSPILEAAEEDLLPAGSAFCGGIQAKLGAIMKGAIPVPDIFVSSGFVCEQTPKIDELIGERYGIPVAYVDGPLDASEKVWPQVSARRTEYLAQEARDALTIFKKVTGYTITEDLSRRANLRAADLFMHFNRITHIVRNADPIPINLNNVCRMGFLMLSVSTTTLYKDDMERLIDLLYTEIKERVDRGEGVLPKGAPRVAIGLFWTDPAPLSMIEKTGLAVIGSSVDGVLITKEERVPSKYEDFWENSAESVLRFCGIKFAVRLKQVCKEAGLDGVILNYPIGCRDLCIAPIKGKELITKELGIPVLLLETDHVDTRSYNAEAMRSRVEAFAEILKAAKAAETK
jgi:benzoyl-CoA reductase/2-hydroxyglutaryl-CoA dehydratase subunit BcrC/BadD/HgdB